MTDAVVRTSERNGVFRIVMERPPANALGLPLLEGLDVATTAFCEGSAKVAVVYSALPDFFAAGADVKHMLTLSTEEFANYGNALRAPLERLACCGKPSIAAIDGLALGGGLELAMACSLRFATPSSKLGLPEVKLGLIPGAGGTQRLPRLVGRGRALELTLSGRAVEAAEGERTGLVDKLIDGDVVAEALAFAQRLAGFSAQAMRALLDCADAAEGDRAAGLRFESDAVVGTFAEGEAREGLAAFVDKRPPVFA
jgi:enoyl-CoA hydratase